MTAKTVEEVVTGAYQHMARERFTVVATMVCPWCRGIGNGVEPKEGDLDPPPACFTCCGEGKVPVTQF